ncbi:hypothetical protein SELMODRAFT_409908 [Selaginella moellendorffii]|uniref:Uncharacterized protein n=1 Tax=Selaginella moellendorffii TaxID=88036 RepID=D8RCV0_SELML|nr:hypothetical protein SELMODRAFT_409908 [Selaginella moellendorffii]
MVGIDEIIDKERSCWTRKWTIKSMGLEEEYVNSSKEPREFLKCYLSKIREYSGVAPSGDANQKRGEIIAVVSSISRDSHLDLLDQALDVVAGPYVCFGLLLWCSYYLYLYRWERLANGSVVKLCSDSFYLCSNVVPAICSMFRRTRNPRVRFIHFDEVELPMHKRRKLKPVDGEVVRESDHDKVVWDDQSKHCDAGFVWDDLWKHSEDDFVWDDQSKHSDDQSKMVSCNSLPCEIFMDSSEDFLSFTNGFNTTKTKCPAAILSGNKGG